MLEMIRDQAPALSPMIGRDRIVGGVLLVGGVAMAAYGGWSLVGLVGEVASERPTVTTGSAVFGVPPLGLCLAGFGSILLMAGAVRPEKKRPTSATVFGGTLAMGAIALALLAAGPRLIDGLMRAEGYRPCARTLGVRSAYTQWVVAAGSCDMPRP